MSNKGKHYIYAKHYTQVLAHAIRTNNVELFKICKKQATGDIKALKAKTPKSQWRWNDSLLIKSMVVERYAITTDLCFEPMSSIFDVHNLERTIRKNLCIPTYQPQNGPNMNYLVVKHGHHADGVRVTTPNAFRQHNAISANVSTSWSSRLKN